MGEPAKVVSLFDVLPRDGQLFVLFWLRYPRKQARFAAEREWAKLSPPAQAAALEALPAHIAHWQLSGTERRFVPHASTWLHQRRWEDELAELDAPLTELGQCCWNRNGNQEPAGVGRCEEPAVATDPEWGNVFCRKHALRKGLLKR